MKLFIGVRYIPFLFILLTTVFGQEFITTKTVVSCIDSTNFVMLTKDGEQPTVFKRNYKLTTPTTISTQYKADADLYLSSGIRIHLSDESSITINSAEQDISKDEQGEVQLSGDGLGVVINAKIDQGRADFKLDSTPNESSSIIVLTDHAELEVHATQFTIVVSSYGFTRVRCIDGYLLATMSNNKVERIENEEVSIYNGNEVILRTLVSVPLYSWIERKLPTVKWNGTDLTVTESHMEP